MYMNSLGTQNAICNENVFYPGLQMGQVHAECVQPEDE